MALSEISIIQDALGDNVSLDVIKEIAKFLRYNRHDLRTIPDDGMTRIFALNMKIIPLDTSIKPFFHEDNVYVTRTEREHTGREYTGHEYMFNFTVNGTPWKLTYGCMYKQYLHVIFDTRCTSRTDVRLLPHSSECQDS